MLDLRNGLALVTVLLGTLADRAAAADPASGRAAASDHASRRRAATADPASDRAAAADPAPRRGAQAQPGSLRKLDAATLKAYRALARPRGSSWHVMGTAALGMGVRFNNPFRLQTQLGDTAESLSLTGQYLDAGPAFTLGPADGVQHGAALRISIPLWRLEEPVITPSYFVTWWGPRRNVLGYGRAGAAVLTAPDFNVGGELAAGLGYFITSQHALSIELVGDLFFGAATWERSYTVHPVLSAQIGFLFDREVLP